VEWNDLVSDYEHSRECIGSIIPSFTNQQPGGFHLRNAVANRDWCTSTRRANFISNALLRLSAQPDHLRLMTLRSHIQYITTI
jgi:hypothetical protein